MKLSCIALLSCLLLTACSPQDSPKLPPGVEAVPRQQGNWLFINYWAIWCAPCRVEIPELNEFAAEHADQVIVYGVNFDDVDPETLLVQAAELGIEFTLLSADPGEALGYARPMMLPTTMVINPEGEIMARLLGPQTLDNLAAALTAEKRELPPTLR